MLIRVSQYRDNKGSYRVLLCTFPENDDDNAMTPLFWEMEEGRDTICKQFWSWNEAKAWRDKQISQARNQLSELKKHYNELKTSRECHDEFESEYEVRI